MKNRWWIWYAFRECQLGIQAGTKCATVPFCVSYAQIKSNQNTQKVCKSV